MRDGAQEEEEEVLKARSFYRKLIRAYEKNKEGAPKRRTKERGSIQKPYQGEEVLKAFCN